MEGYLDYTMRVSRERRKRLRRFLVRTFVLQTGRVDNGSDSLDVAYAAFDDSPRQIPQLNVEVRTTTSQVDRLWALRERCFWMPRDSTYPLAIVTL